METKRRTSNLSERKHSTSSFATHVRNFAESLASSLNLWKETVVLIYKSGIATVLVSMILLAVLGAIIALYFELNSPQSAIHSIPHALWWAIVTMTTTGYGDIVPMTWSGRIAAVMLMIGGIALVSLFSATISSVFVILRLKEGSGLEKIHWTDHIVVCGWNSIAHNYLDAIKPTDDNLRIAIVNNRDPEHFASIIHQHPEIEFKFVKGDVTQEETLRRANVVKASTAIVFAEEGRSDDLQVLVVLALRSISKSVHIFAQVNEEKTIYHIKRAGADGLSWVNPYAGFLLAKHTISPGIPQVYDELLNPNRSTSLYRVFIPKEWHGKSLGQFAADYRNKSGSLIIGLLQEEFFLSKGDILSHDLTPIDEFINRKLTEVGLSPSELQRGKIKLNPPDSTILKPLDVAIAIPQSENDNE